MPRGASSALEHVRDVLRSSAATASARPPSGLTHDHADDTAGTAATDDAIRFDPLPLLVALDRCGARVVVIGQVAGILHGSREGTGDLDLLWDGSETGAVGMVRAFTDVGAALADDDGRSVPCDVSSLLLPKVLFRTPTASGDCCTPALPWGELPVREYLGRALTVETEQGAVIRYLRREDLMSMRRAAGRPKDLRRLAELERRCSGC